MKEIIFICGVNGVGKSTLIPRLKPLLSEKEFVVHDFDERGVPENAGSAWRASETRHWIELAKMNAQKNLTTIICGFVKPTDFGDAIQDIGSTIQCILLDANPDVIRARLMARYMKNGIFNPQEIIIGKTVQEFIEGNIYIRGQLKTEYKKLGCSVIDTSSMEPAEVAEKIIELMR